MTQRTFSKNIANVSSVKTNQSQLTPTNKKTSKSPISHSKCSHQTSSKQNVSYGELQIVLENIQTIKQKATTQVKQLNDENNLLREEILQMESCIEKLTKMVKEQAESIKDAEQKCKAKVQSLEEDNRNKLRRIEEKDISINLLNLKLNQLQNNIVREKEISALTSKELEELRKKWNWSFGILAGDHTRAEEIVWKVKDKNCSLWDIFHKITSLESAVDLKIQKIQTLTEELAQCKAEHRRTCQMLDKSLDQINIANEKLSKNEQQVKQYYLSVLGLKDEKNSLQTRIQSLLRENGHLKTSIEHLELKANSISEDLMHRDIQNASKEKQIQFASLVNEICDETQDYAKVLDRVHYLQRFRRQHYFNVQKIQFLCKLLDN